MLIKTHLAITLFFVLLLVSYVEDKMIFVLVALVSTIIPDIDSRFSMIGQKTIARILQFFTKHRGIIHSYTLLLIVTIISALFVPVLALPFFLGYGMHLFADSFNISGIRPFYPLKRKAYGKFRTGGKTEVGILILFIILDTFLLFAQISSMF